VLQALQCDDVLEFDTTTGENIFAEYGCVGWNESGPELGFAFDSPVDDLVVFTIEYGDPDLDLFLMADTCTPDACVEYGNKEIEAEVEGGRHYFVVVDGYGGDAGPFTITVWCQSTCEPQCEEGSCSADGCGGVCPCEGEGEVCYLGDCCLPSCDGKECGSDGCGGSCGECGEGLYCKDFHCLEPTCEGSCGGSSGMGCWCDPSCHEFGDCCDDVCDFCPFIGDCLDLTNCGDGSCNLDVGESCETCVEDCACGEGEVCLDHACCQAQCEPGMECQSDGCEGTCPCPEEGDVCYDGECCTPSCEGKECGDDGCGGVCGACVVGACVDGLCLDAPGCVTSDQPGCGGCPCEACVCAMDSWCCNNSWDSLCVSECINECGGCADLSNCGDGSCDAAVGESCSSCPEDCGCPPGEACGVLNGATACVLDVCALEITGIGCCDGDTLRACHDGKSLVLECPTIDNVCGWYPGDASYEPGYYCGPEDLVIVTGDPSGEYPLSCVPCDPACAQGEKCVDGECVVCVPECDGKNCGADGCGGQCGECPDGLVCFDGLCGAVGCEPLDTAGCAGCPCEECVCAMDPYCCDTQWDDICVGECVNDCGGCPAPDPWCGDLLCNADEDCGSCPGDCPCGAGESCVEGECVACTADCQEKECGDDGCGGSCGECSEDMECIDGLCVEPAGSCDGFCGEQAGNCYCDELCFENGDCCDDVCDFCSELEGCGECVPDCLDKECGDDGCGGICGVCDGGVCIEDVCVAAAECGNGVVDDGEECEADEDCAEGESCIDCLCEPTVCVPDCVGKVCGDDGCQGSCGDCAAGEECLEGLCVPPEADVVTQPEPQETDAVAADAVGAEIGEDLGGDDGGKKGSNGCTSTDGGSPAAALLLFGAVLLLGARRRRLA
jgi:MYXO-CTERM domain-containing protein